MHIRKGTPADLDAVEAIYHDILDYQAATINYTNWIKGKYPTRRDAQLAQEAGTLYVMEEDGRIVACVNLNQIQPPEYANINWSIPAQPHEVLVIHTLCVPPQESGKGYARAFVSFAEKLGREKGCKAIRLDTYEGNEPAKAMYPKLGYTPVGKTWFHFQNVIWEYLECFDKAL